MSHTISILLDGLELFCTDIPGLPITGANLVTAGIIKQLCRHKDIEAIEIFLPPAVMTQVDQQANTALNVLPPDLRGQGRLRFYPIHTLPEVWQDKQPRIFYCIDPARMVQARYLRDTFACAPTPIVCDIHGLGHQELWPAMAPLAHLPGREYDAIVCGSKAGQFTLQKTFEGFLAPDITKPPCRIDHLPRFVDTRTFHPYSSDSKLEARRILQLPEDSVITLYLGRVTAHSKADLLPLIKAFTKASNRPGDILVIAGEEYPAGYSDKLYEFGKSLGLSGRLYFFPRVQPSMRPLFYGASDVFVFPGDTIQEVCPSTILEAMACGLPSVISDWDGLRDIIVDNISGYKVPTFWMPELIHLDQFSPVVPVGTEYLLASQRVWIDTDRLTNDMQALILSPSLRSQIGRSARNRVVKEYAIDVVIDKLIGLLDELAQIADKQFINDNPSSIHAALPTQYDAFFQHYATHVIDIKNDEIRLSDYGSSVANGNEQIQLYDDTLSLVRIDVIRSILIYLSQKESYWTAIADVVDTAVRETQRSPHDILFLISILLKRDMLEFRRVG